MTLKSLRSNYTRLLKAFDQAGVKLNESQKESLDTFMLDLETKINETRNAAIKATKKVVEEKLEKEYKTVVESILAHQKEIMETSGKIQAKKAEQAQRKAISESVDNYLDTYIQEVLPKKTIVDYDRMKKLESLHESLKDLLVVNDEAVEAKVEKVKADFVKESSELKATVEALEKKLNESMKKELSLNRKLDEAKARELVAEKTKDLPIVESKEMRRRLRGMSVAEIQKKFDVILEEVSDKIADERNCSQEEKNLEEAISDIVNGTGAASEENDEKAKETATDPIPTQDSEEEFDDPEPEPLDGEEDGDVSVPIAESQMEQWVNSFCRLVPNK